MGDRVEPNFSHWSVMDTLCGVSWRASWFSVPQDRFASLPPPLGGRAGRAPWPLICGARLSTLSHHRMEGRGDWVKLRMAGWTQNRRRWDTRSDGRPDPGSCDGFLLRKGGTAPRKCNCRSDKYGAVPYLFGWRGPSMCPAVRTADIRAVPGDNLVCVETNCTAQLNTNETPFLGKVNTRPRKTKEIDSSQTSLE